MWTVFDITPTYVVCIYILWDVPRDTLCNIGTGHIGQIYSRVLAGLGYDLTPPYIIGRHRDFQKLYSLLLLPPSLIKKTERLFAIVQLYEHIFCLSTG